MIWFIVMKKLILAVALSPRWEECSQVDGERGQEFRVKATTTDAEGSQLCNYQRSSDYHSRKRENILQNYPKHFYDFLVLKNWAMCALITTSRRGKSTSKLVAT